MSLVVALLIGLNPTPLANLPFEYEPGRIWLKGTLNGQPMWTMLDSGAGGIIVTEEAAARAGGTKGEAFRANTIGDPTEAWWDRRPDPSESRAQGGSGAWGGQGNRHGKRRYDRGG